MSEQTQKMAEDLYDGMAAYVGADHRGYCVQYLKFALDSMETEIEKLKQEVAMKKPSRLEWLVANVLLVLACLSVIGAIVIWFLPI